MRYRHLFIALVAGNCAMMGSSAFAQDAAPTPSDKPPASTKKVTKQQAAANIEAYLTACHEARVCNGSYLVLQNGKVVYRGAFGHAGDAAHTPLGTEMMFDIGSISKQFAAAAVLKLEEQRKLSLDDKIAKYLPTYPYADVTIRQLLNHTSGMPDILPIYTRKLRAGSIKGAVTGADVIDIINEEKLPLKSDPGSRFTYNNSGYLVLALVIEERTKQSFADYLDRQFFKPLGMKHSWVRTEANDSKIAPRAYGFRAQPGAADQKRDQLPQVYLRGPGGIYSTVDDLARWQNALLAGKVISAKSWAKATTPTILSDGKDYPYGYGLTLKPTADGYARIWHSGHWRGFKSELSYFPATKVTVVQLTNNGQDDSIDQTTADIARIFDGKDPNPQRALVTFALADKFKQGSVADAQAWLASEISAQPRRYNFEEDALNAYAYDLLESKDDPASQDKALMLFEAIVNLYPKSANAYDGLADAYVAKGDDKAALAQIKKGLAVDPGSTLLQNRLSKMEGQGKK